MKKLSKLGLVGATVIATAPAISSITSCSNQIEPIDVKSVVLGQEFDKEYGVEEANYIAYKDDFRTQYKNILEGQGRTEEEVQTQMDAFESRLNAFDKKMSSSQNNFGFTAKIQSLRNYAEKYNVILGKHNSIDYEDLRADFIKMKDSFSIYMDNNGFDPNVKALVLQAAESNFQEIMSEKENYNDPLSFVMEKKGDLIGCFAEINEGIALIAATARLKQFFQDYHVEYNEVGTDNKLDQLKAAGLKENTTISDTLMNRIFKIKSIQNPDQPILFSSTMIPGYILNPVAKVINEDIRTNKNNIQVDWQCVKASHFNKGKKYAEQVTAHLYCNEVGFFDGEKLPANLDDMTFDDIKTIFNDMLQPQYTSYEIPLSPEVEKANLQKAYYSDNNDVDADSLTFKWDTSGDGVYIDQLIRGTKHYELNPSNDGYVKYIAGPEQLAAAGLMIGTKNKLTNESTEFVRLDKYIPTHSLTHGYTEKEIDEAANTQPQLVNNVLQNCSLCGIVSIDPKEKDEATGKNVAYVKLILKYNSSVTHTKDYWEDGEAEDVYIDLTTSTNDEKGEKLVGISESRDAYMYLTTQFNAVCSNTDFYAQDEFQKIMDQTDDEFQSIGITTALGYAINGLCILSMWNLAKMPVIAAVIGLTFASIAAELTVAGIFFFKKYVPVTQYHLRNEEFLKTDVCTNLVKKVDEDSQNYGFIRTKDKIIREADFNTAYEKYFKNKNFDEVYKATTRYQEWIDNKDSEFGKFMQETYDRQISIEQFEADMKDWQKVGWCTKAVEAITIADVSLNVLILILSIAMVKIAAIQAARAAQAEDLAKQAEGASLLHYEPLGTTINPNNVTPEVLPPSFAKQAVPTTIPAARREPVVFTSEQTEKFIIEMNGGQKPEVEKFYEYDHALNKYVQVEEINWTSAMGQNRVDAELLTKNRMKEVFNNKGYMFSQEFALSRDNLEATVMKKAALEAQAESLKKQIRDCPKGDLRLVDLQKQYNKLLQELNKAEIDVYYAYDDVRSFTTADRYTYLWTDKLLAAGPDSLRSRLSAINPTIANNVMNKIRQEFGFKLEQLGLAEGCRSSGVDMELFVSDQKFFEEALSENIRIWEIDEIINPTKMGRMYGIMQLCAYKEFERAFGSELESVIKLVKF